MALKKQDGGRQLDLDILLCAYLLNRLTDFYHFFIKMIYKTFLIQLSNQDAL